MSKRIKDLLKPPFRKVGDYDISDKRGNTLGLALCLYDLCDNEMDLFQDFRTFIAEALNEKCNRSFTELRWDTYENISENLIALVCPKCGDGLRVQYEHITLAGFCPYCGQKLLPPEETA